LCFHCLYEGRDGGKVSQVGGKAVSFNPLFRQFALEQIEAGCTTGDQGDLVAFPTKAGCNGCTQSRPGSEDCNGLLVSHHALQWQYVFLTTYV